MTPKEKFWSRVSKTESCWLWTGAKTSRGYGNFRIGASMKGAHRVSWEWANNQEIPKGQLIMHTCDVRNCVNPAHLMLGTHKENMEDRNNKKRQAYGVKNHAAILNEEKVLEIREKYKSWKAPTQEQLAKEYGVKRSTIQNIVTRTSWKHV